MREIAGVALLTVDEDSDMEDSPCHPSQEQQSIVQIYYENFFFLQSGERTRRHLVESLEYDLSTAASTQRSIFASDAVRNSPYRVVRVVDRSGETVVMRQSQETSLTCSRQGYYRHPENCNHFYRCVKFDQYVDDFTVFEYECPDGLVFDEKYETCTWPSQTAPCGGSSEIMPVPKQKFNCPGEGYFADPENCRWFFACRDYSKDGTFTQYEFRCPFGLVFDEQNLLCNWPWLVPQCPSSGRSDANANYAASQQTYSRQPALEQQSYDKPKQPLAPKGVSIGSPGYLSGKLVTGEGMYKDTRPAHLSDSVVSAGCIDCHSASLTLIREPSAVTYPPPPQQKYQYTGTSTAPIPASAIVAGTAPVRILPTTYTPSESYPPFKYSVTTERYNNAYKPEYESPRPVQYPTESKVSYGSVGQQQPVAYKPDESRATYEGKVNKAPVEPLSYYATTSSYKPTESSNYRQQESSYEKERPSYQPQNVGSLENAPRPPAQYSGGSYEKEPTVSRDYVNNKNYPAAVPSTISYPTPAPKSLPKPTQSYAPIPKLDVAQYYPEIETGKVSSYSPVATHYNHQLPKEEPAKASGYENKKSNDAPATSYRPQQEYAKPQTTYQPEASGYPYENKKISSTPVTSYQPQQEYARPPSTYKPVEPPKPSGYDNKKTYVAPAPVTSYQPQSEYVPSTYKSEEPPKASGYENKKISAAPAPVISYQPQQEYVKPPSTYKANTASQYAAELPAVQSYNRPASNYNSGSASSASYGSSNQEGLTGYTQPSGGYVEQQKPSSYPSPATYNQDKSYSSSTNGASKQQETYPKTTQKYTDDSPVYYQVSKAEKEPRPISYDNYEKQQPYVQTEKPSSNYANNQPSGDVGNVALYYRVEQSTLKPSYPKEGNQQYSYTTTEKIYKQPETTTSRNYANTGYPQNANVAVFYQEKPAPSKPIEEKVQSTYDSYTPVKSDEKTAYPSPSYGSSPSRTEIDEPVRYVQKEKDSSLSPLYYTPSTRPYSPQVEHDYSQSSLPKITSYPQSTQGVTYDAIENKYNSAPKDYSPSAYPSESGKGNRGQSAGSEYSKTKAVEPTRYSSSSPNSNAKYSSSLGESAVKQSAPISTSNDGSRYGDKIVTVKVPSVNKAALLNKWGSTTSSRPSAAYPSDTSDIGSKDYSDYKTDQVAPSTSYTDASLSSNYDNTPKNTQRIKAKKPSTSHAVSSADKAYGSTASTSSSSYPQDSQDKSYSKLNSTVSNTAPKKSTTDSGYGQRYLEKISIDKARNETLSPDVCVRAGLFRHPSDCQKFYEVSTFLIVIITYVCKNFSLA